VPDDPRAGLQVATSEDALLGGRVRLRQPMAGFRAAIDPVFLAAAVPAEAGASVLDLGCGVGAAALCLLARQADIRVTGLEIDSDLVKLADANAHLNGVADRLLAVHGDVAKPPPRLAPGTFHHVMCNPPFLPAGASNPSALPSRDAAMREGAVVLADWVRLALIMVRPQGSVTLIHRADRLDAILATLSDQAGEISVYPLWPGAGKPAKRVIVRARKGVAAPVCLCPGLILHEPDGGFTAAAEVVLRDAAALRF
jgi:tRNA1(Val) A37 N6-methylase TrmN6